MNETATRDTVLAFCAENYRTEPEYPWRGYPENAVLRHPNGKWYGIILPVAREKLGLPEEGICDVLNVKCEPLMLGSMLTQNGFFPAYHMNKANWISVLLDGTVPAERVLAALKTSYALIGMRAGTKKRTEPKPWLVPANPKYENLAETLAVTKETLWKQSGKFIVGDTVYIYEGKPIAAITYACEVTETDLPYHYDQGGLHMETVMRMKLLRQYAPAQFPLERLHDFGIVSVRGPRSVPPELLAALEHS